MIDSFGFDDDVQDVEALIGAAGNYVQPSEDLRPRVMEVVRSERLDRRVRWRLGQAAVLFVLLNLLATSTLQQVELAEGALPESGREFEGGTESPAYRDRENWDTVESFRELRRRQAYLLRLHL